MDKKGDEEVGLVFLNISVENNAMRGKLIAIEGLDGAGLTTQCVLLRNYLMQKHDVMLTKEPTEGLIGGILKSTLRKEWKTDPQTLQMLFASDRSQHLTSEIEPAIRDGIIVITDRYLLSSLAFGTLDLPLSFMTQLNGTFRKPEITIFLDTQPAICIERIKKSRHHLEMFETEEKLTQVRKNFLEVRKHIPGTQMVDGNRNYEVIHDEIKRIVERRL